MNILITGNMGYIGPAVVRHLRLAYPHAVLVGMDIGYFADCLSGSAVFPECAVDIQHFADVRCYPDSLLRGIDSIVYLAAISNDPMGSAFEKVTYDINHAACVAMAADAKRAGVMSFVYASSCSIYGFASDKPKTEDSPLNPLTAYARSKVFAEDGLRAVASDDFIVTCLRFATACGMSSRLRLDLVLNDFVASAVLAGKISILSDGTPWRPLINTKDMARAIDWAIARRTDSGGAFLAVNVGKDDWNFQVRDLAEAVAGVMPGTKIEVNKDAVIDKRSYRVDFSRYRGLAGEQYLPKESLRETIEDLKSGIEAMDMRGADFRESNLVRLRTIRRLMSQGLLNKDLEWSFKSRGQEALRES